jgi:hypothetical protein
MDPSEAAEPIENADANEPIEHTDSTEPTDPTDRTDPLDAIDRNESLERNDSPSTRSSVAVHPELCIRSRVLLPRCPQQSTCSGGRRARSTPSSTHARYAMLRCIPSTTSTVSSNTPIRTTTSELH